MSAPGRIRSWYPYGALLLLWGAMFSMACRIADTEVSMDRSGDTVLGQLMGASREAVGEHFYDMADMYFHRGVPVHHEAAFEHTFFQEMKHKIQPTGHVHARGETIKEMMPWLRFATQMDPHNVQAYLVAAYWIQHEVDDPAKALEILQEGARNNPHDYRMYAEMGRMYMHLGERRRAAEALETGIHLWPGKQDPEEEETRLELARMLSFRAFLYEVEGRKERALAFFRQSSRFSPGNRALLRRIKRLESDDAPIDWAKGAWEELFPANEVCARGDVLHGHDHDHEHDHDHAEHVHDEHCGHLDHGEHSH